MQIVYVKHYLTPEGISYFEREWFPWVDSVIKVQEGFVSITYSQDFDAQDCMNITLKFLDDPTLDAWIAVPIHEDLIQALDPLRSRNYWEAVRTGDENVSPSSLEWMVIKPEN